jgi:hypothetical protein
LFHDLRLKFAGLPSSSDGINVPSARSTWN